jgi:hypothetical protein
MATSSFVQGIRRFYRALASINKAHPAFIAFVALVAVPSVLIGGAVLVEELSEVYYGYKFNHLSSAEHLRVAQDICHSKQFGAICYGLDPNEAVRHLEKIPRDAPEYAEGSRLLEVIHQQERASAERQQRTLAEQAAKRTHLLNQTQQESLEQMYRNVAGTAHDSYICATSTVGTQILSIRQWEFLVVR